MTLRVMFVKRVGGDFTYHFPYMIERGLYTSMFVKRVGGDCTRHVR